MRVFKPRSGAARGAKLTGLKQTLARKGCVSPHPDRARLGVRSTRDPRRPITTHARSRPAGRLRRAGLSHVLDSCYLRSCKIKNNMLVLVTRLFRNSRVFAVALGPVMFPRRAGLLYPPGRRLRVSVPTHRLVKHSLGGYGDVLLVFSVRRVSTPPLLAASELMSQRALH